MLVSDLLSELDLILQDPDYGVWAQNERIRWLNAAVRQVLVVRPDAHTETATVQLVAGPYQTIPTGHLKFLALIKNMGTDGATPGRVIRQVDREATDLADPTWQAMAGATEIDAVMVDPDDPLAFWVYPPVHATTAVYALLRTSVAPDPIALTTDSPAYKATDELDMPLVYQSPIIDYAAYRCFSSNRAEAAQAMAAGFLASFNTSLGVKSQKDFLTAPKTREAPYGKSAKPTSYGV